MLPSNYVRLDYIQSSGTEYIDTNFDESNGNRRIEMKVLFPTLSSTFVMLFGNDYGSSGHYTFARTSSSQINLGAGDYTQYNISSLANTIYDYDIKQHSGNSYFSIDGVKRITKSNSFSFPSGTLLIFAKRGDHGIEASLPYRLYKYKLFDNNENLIRDMIPAKNKDTGVVGLYDLANDVFYTNAGTGSFTYGHEIPENIILEDNPLQFDIGDDVELQANFKIRYTITLDYDETLGTAYYSWVVGSDVNLSALPNSNAQFKGWYINNQLISRDLNTTYSVSGDTTFEARFEQVYEITTSSIGDGSIGINRQATDLNIVEIYAIPNANRHFVKYEIDGVEETQSRITLTLTQNISVVAYFEEDDKFHITASANIDYTSVYVSHNDDYAGYTSTLWARPFPNYVFDEWSDGNKENPRTIEIDNDITLIALFKHIIETNGIYQYRCYVKDQLNMTDVPKAFMVVDTFNIKQDYLTNANSTIEVLEMADNVNNGDVIVVYNPKGETIYQGVITSISDLKITTSQMQSFYKGLWIYNNHLTSTYVEDEVAYLLGEYADGKVYGSTYIDPLVAQRLGGITIRHTNSISGNLPTDLDKDGNEKLTQYDMEKFIYKLYQDYGIVFEFTINMEGQNYVDIKVPTYTSLSIGNNHYAIMNLSPIQKIEETNKLIIYNADKTYRTTYVATTSGIVEAPTSLANRFNITNTKVVYSDDSVDDLISANLPTQMYSHKITFDLLLKNNLYQFSEFKLGMPLVIWYNGTDYYNSVLTGRSFKKSSNQNVSQVSYTCGLVRTTLTNKLTLGNV